jgi:hypothetical protein
MKDKEPTKEEIESYCQKLIGVLKKDPQWELQQEFGQLLFRHIDSFTPDERKRYEELKVILSNPDTLINK